MKCTACDNNLSDHDHFCSYCGTPAEEVDDRAYHSTWIGWWIAGHIALGFVLGLIWYVCSGSPPPVLVGFITPSIIVLSVIFTMIQGPVLIELLYFAAQNKRRRNLKTHHAVRTEIQSRPFTDTARQFIEQGLRQEVRRPQRLTLDLSGDLGKWGRTGFMSLAAGPVLLVLIYVFGGDYDPGPVDSVVLSLVASIISGASLGFVQQDIFRPHFRQVRRWILFTVVGAALGTSFGLATYTLLINTIFFPTPIPVEPPFARFQAMRFHDASILTSTLLGWTVGAAVFGIITAQGITWFLRQSER